jgi:hypothetical protein
MKTLTVLLLAGATFGVASPASGESFQEASRGCPPDHGFAAWRIGNILNSPLLPDLRARFDLGTASAEDVRLLTNREDRETCVRLWEALEASGTKLNPADEVSFYQSGNVYFVPVTLRPQLPPGVVRLDGGSALHVYDADFRLIGRFSA